MDAVRLASAGYHNWVAGIARALHAVQYPFDVQAGALPQIDIPCLQHKLSAAHDMQWQGLDDSPRLAPSRGARLCTYVRWFARPSSSGLNISRLPVSARIVKRLLRFRTGCHGLPRDVGGWDGTARQDRVCTLCHGGIGDEQHMIFECGAFADLRLQHQGLFDNRYTMLDFMWQPDACGVAVFVDKCLDRYEDAAGGR